MNQTRRPRPRVRRQKVGDRIAAPVTIERIVAGGLGLARVLDRVVFVSGAAPGDVARLEIERVQGKTAFARIVDLVEPSPDRIEPPHPRLTECGGADFQHLRYEAQLRIKVEILRDALRRIGRIDAPDEIEVVPSPDEWGYRSRAEWHYDPALPALGYVGRRSHEVCDLADDPFAVAPLRTIFGDLRQRMIAGDLPASATGIRVATAGDDVSIAPPLVGDDVREVEASVAGERLRYDAAAFFQTNLGVLDALVAEALRFAPAPAAREEQPFDTVAIDLYAGVGLFTLPLARRYRRVVAVEGDERTAGFLARNVAAAGMTQVRSVVAPVERWLADAYRTYGRTAHVVVDPPRDGLSPRAVPSLLLLRPARLTYVSCDPATLARDLRVLVDREYRLERLTVVDMFPQTHHVEALAHLVREKPETA